MQSQKEKIRNIMSEYTHIIRKRRCMTQEAMADKLDITPRAYSDIERGKYCISSTAMVLFILQLDDNELEYLLAKLRAELLASKQEVA